jgi:uncharacterized protein (UPF0332 family)
MRADDFVSFASQLAAKPGGSAVSYRSAISRAYYGAYHRARLLVEQMGFRTKTGQGNEHLYLRRLLQGSDVDAADEVGTLLGNLHSSRRDADYDLDEPTVETQRHATVCAERATDLLSKLAACSQPPLFDAIKLGIAAYKVRTNDT